MTGRGLRLLLTWGMATFFLQFFPSCRTSGPETGDSALYEVFRNPPADARPMVRWWWNGNCVEADEIRRELAVMKKAGIGGVEINSIAMPEHAGACSTGSLQWAGKAWSSMVRTASEEAVKQGMISDLIVGSGWPFGGRFLKEDEIMQRVGIRKQLVKANSTLNIDIKKYLGFESHHLPGTTDDHVTSDVDLVSVKLIPRPVTSLDEVVDITREVKDNRLVYAVDNRNYVLVFVYLERNFNKVTLGSPGADGPIMDHYKHEAVMDYLNRLKAIEEATGLSLQQLIRALFCDSIELSGSNWTDDMAQEFQVRNGYSVMPYLPFVIQPPGKRNRYEASPAMADTLKRVQYDFYHTIIDLFLERFTMQFQEFCSDNGVLCRYQAYGTPYYMGLFQGYMIPDIPESNSWIYSGARDEAGTDEYTWVQGHGYMLWNKAASSASHVMGRKITSCEAMTNTQGVFRTSLETVKQSDDMNFITGVNHSVLHGFNYSPPEAGFPGWVRFGSYFSEQNSWWKYFPRWTGYNARLSSLFQHSKPVADIAVLSRLRDLWGEVGPDRPPLNMEPWYYARLWEPISNLGSSCDYIHQTILEDAKVEGTELQCGKMHYKVLLLSGVESLTPKAALKLQEFAGAGGTIVFIGKTPHRSLSLKDASTNDTIVRKAVEAALHAGHVIQMAAPGEPEDLIDWTREMLERTGTGPQVKISDPVSHLYCMKQYHGETEIFFFANSHRKRAVEFDATFDTPRKKPYIWLPETGERFALSFKERNKIHLKLEPLESALIVFEPAKLNFPAYQVSPSPVQLKPFKGSWDVTFEHVNGKVFSRKMDRLIDFSTSADTAIRNFAGTVSYSTTFENQGGVRFVRLSEVNEGVSELVVNGRHAGIRWYGNHCYHIAPYVKQGTNRIEIKLTNTLANYCGSLTDNPAAQAWTRFYHTPVPSGLEGVELGE